MNKQIFKQIIIDQAGAPLPRPLVSRYKYSDIQPLLANKQVIVITGIRRCGKSTLLHLIRSQSTQSD